MAKKKARNALFCQKSVLKHSRRFLGFCELCQNGSAMRQFNNLPAPKRDERKKTKMKKIITPFLIVGLFAAGGCSSPVNVSGDYSTPKQTISGDVNATTNSVTVSGAYSTTNQTVGGSVTVGK